MTIRPLRVALDSRIRASGHAFETVDPSPVRMGLEHHVWNMHRPVALRLSEHDIIGVLATGLAPVRRMVR